MRYATVSRREAIKLSAALGSALAMPGVLRAEPPRPTAVTTDMIEAAGKEGLVVFYTAMDIPLAEELAKAFERRYPGVKVRVKRSGAERIFQRIADERSLGLHEADVVCSTDEAHFVRWKRDGLLAPYVPQDVAQHFPSDAVDPDGMYASVFSWVSPIAYNTQLIKPDGAPKAFADLLDDRWKGAIVKANPSYSGTILTATFELARDLGWSYFEKLARQDVTQVQSALEPPKLIATGKHAVQADGVDSELTLLKDTGAPVEIIYAAEGTPLITTPSAVFASAPQPNAARLFQSFLFSLEAQQFLVDRGALHSFHALVKERPGRPPLSAIKLMRSDPGAVAAQSDDVKARYTQIFGLSSASSGDQR
jgi:iron(III) transport system substrate-binding protein